MLSLSQPPFRSGSRDKEVCLVELPVTIVEFCVLSLDSFNHHQAHPCLVTVAGKGHASWTSLS